MASGPAGLGQACASQAYVVQKDEQMGKNEREKNDTSHLTLGKSPDYEIKARETMNC